MRYLIVLLMIPLVSVGQTVDTVAGHEKDTSTWFLPPEEEEIDEDEVFQIVETMPRFRRGGESALMKYLVNTQYPYEAYKYGIEGVVYVQFVIDKEGNVTNAKVIRGADVILDRVALKRVKEMSKWKPGKQRGKLVRVMFRVRINFKLT